MTDSSQLAQIASRVTDIAGAKSELSIQTAAATALLNEQQQAIIDDAKVVASIFNKYGSGASSEASTERASTFVGVALAAAIMGILIL